MEPHSSLQKFNSNENKESKPENDQEEALSLCDLATNEPNEPEPEPYRPEQQPSHEEDFDFGWGGTNLIENKMCSADEVFFKGQILSSSFMAQTREFTHSISFSRSEPVSAVSSRSSSSHSQNSVTSGSSSTAGFEPRNGNQNQFYSNPSPTPQIRTRSFRHSNLKTSSKWSFLQLGPLKPQEIGLLDLKNRSQRSNYGNNMNENEKKKQILLFGGCKCSADVIETIITISSSSISTTLNAEEESKVGRRKHAVSAHRTSEWLKQLSIQKPAPF